MSHQASSQYQTKSSDFTEYMLTICSLLSKTVTYMLFSPFMWKLILLQSSSGCDVQICMWKSVCVYMFYEPWQQLSSDDRFASYCNSTVQVNVLVMCVCECAVITLPSCVLSEALYMAVGLQAREEDVEEPESKEKQWREDFREPWASQFTAYGRSPAQHQHSHSKEGKNGEERDGEGQWAGVHAEDLTFDFPIYGSHRPGHPNAQEHINCIASCHISYACICILVLSSSHFTGKGIWGKKKS